MQQIDDVLSLPMQELDYRINGLMDSQFEILKYLALGKTITEISHILSIRPSTVAGRIYGACDRFGVAKREQLIAAYAIWRYAKNLQRAADSVHPSGLSQRLRGENVKRFE